MAIVQWFHESADDLAIAVPPWPDQDLIAKHLLSKFINKKYMLPATTDRISFVQSSRFITLPVSLILLTAGLCHGGGIYRDGAGARALALGGTSVGQPDTALEAMQANPAGLSAVKNPQLQFGLGGAMANGKFSNVANTDADIDNGFGVWPEAAIAFPLVSTPVTLGFAFIPDAALGGEWNYVDAPGGLGGTTSYGFQEHRSEITALRTAFAASVEITESLSFGAGVGLVYNQNQLHAPYVFQNFLPGFKTLLDLKTDGFGVNGTFGLVYRPCEKTSLGLSYQTSTHINSKGDANGNADVQLANMGAPFNTWQTDFHYDAEVHNVLPQMASLGLSWQVHDRVRALFQVDWINWADSFDELEIYLNNGSNPDFNGVLGSDIYDIVPLRWEDQFVYRAGVEFQATDAVALRCGYTYGNSPVPDSTLTPLTAAIMEHKLSAGAGWKNERYFVDVAYQYSLPSSQSVGTSALQAGEYSNSRTEVQVHTIGLTLGMNF